MPMPEDVKARVMSAYNRAADFYDHPANAFWERYGQRTIDRLHLAPGSQVLDVCCGTGASAIPAAKAVGPSGQVLAVDLAEDLIRLGREKAARIGLRNVEFRVSDMLTLEPTQAQFDCVVCVFGLFFVPDMAGALRHVWTLLSPNGRLAVTTWGTGVFEPVNAIFWEAIRSVRPELFKAFNPWDRLGEPRMVSELFAVAGLPAPETVFEPGRHPLRTDDDITALLMGTGYRGVLEQMSPLERERVSEAVAAEVHAGHIAEVNVDVIYATCKRPAQ